jgi:hypothetical protein
MPLPCRLRLGTWILDLESETPLSLFLTRGCSDDAVQGSKVPHGAVWLPSRPECPPKIKLTLLTPCRALAPAVVRARSSYPALRPFASSEGPNGVPSALHMPLYTFRVGARATAVECASRGVDTGDIIVITKAVTHQNPPPIHQASSCYSTPSTRLMPMQSWQLCRPTQGPSTLPRSH